MSASYLLRGILRRQITPPAAICLILAMISTGGCNSPLRTGPTRVDASSDSGVDCNLVGGSPAQAAPVGEKLVAWQLAAPLGRPHGPTPNSAKKSPPPISCSEPD